MSDDKSPQRAQAGEESLFVHYFHPKALGAVLVRYDQPGSNEDPVFIT